MELLRRWALARDEALPNVAMKLVRSVWSGVCHSLMVGIALWLALACVLTSPSVEIDLIDEPVTLSYEPQLLAAGQPLRADHDSVSVCVYPAPGHNVSTRWTVVAPNGREARVVARAELVNGRVVTLRSPSSDGASLCVHPRWDGPLEAEVQRIRLLASTPIVARRIVWRSTGS